MIASATLEACIVFALAAVDFLDLPGGSGHPTAVVYAAADRGM